MLFSAAARSTQPLAKIVRLRGKVDAGYGRGGKKLGFPTANLPSSLFQNALEQVPTGVYLGWAWIEGGSANGRGMPHKAAVNVGYSPTFEGKENKEKIVEAHLILGAEAQSSMTDFYGEVMRLSLLGYLRPECKFDSFPDLMQAITTDVATAKDALDQAPYLSFRSDDLFLSNQLWIGKDGGDADASWEFQIWNDA
jgi:riboflavin kinase